MERKNKSTIFLAKAKTTSKLNPHIVCMLPLLNLKPSPLWQEAKKADYQIPMTDPKLCILVLNIGLSTKLLQYHTYDLRTWAKLTTTEWLIPVYLTNIKWLFHCCKKTDQNAPITFESLHSQKHHGLTDTRLIILWLNWPIRSMTRV